MARGVDLSPLQAAETFTGERMRSHRGRPPALLQTSLLRTGGRHGLVWVDTNRDSVPGVYILRIGPLAGQTWKSGVYIWSVAVTRGADHGQALCTTMMD